MTSKIELVKELREATRQFKLEPGSVVGEFKVVSAFGLKECLDLITKVMAFGVQEYKEGENTRLRGLIRDMEGHIQDVESAVAEMGSALDDMSAETEKEQ